MRAENHRTHPLSSALALLLLFGGLLLLSLGFRCPVDFDCACSTRQRRRHEVVVFLSILHSPSACLCEQVLDAAALGGTRLNVGVASIFVAPGLGLFAGDHALQVTLIAANNEWEGVGIRGSRLIKEVLLPECESLEALLA